MINPKHWGIQILLLNFSHPFPAIWPWGISYPQSEQFPPHEDPGGLHFINFYVIYHLVWVDEAVIG